MVTALLAASSDNITYADALTESKLRISRKILVASTAHLVDNNAFSRILYFLNTEKRTIPYYLSTWNCNKLSFRLREAPLYCYSTHAKDGKINVFETRGSLDSWFWHESFWASNSWCDYAIFPLWLWKKHEWIWVRCRGWRSGEGHACIGTPYDWECVDNLDEDDAEGQDGTPHSFSFPTPDFWTQDWYHNAFHRYELRYSWKYYRCISPFGINQDGKIYDLPDEPTEEGRYLPFHLPNEFYRDVQYYLQLNAEVARDGVLALSFCNWGGYFGVNIFGCHWAWLGDGWGWTRPKLGWVKIPDTLSVQTDMIVTISITAIPGEPDTYLVLFSAFHDNWSKNYYKKIRIHSYWDRNYNSEWDGSFFEPIYDERGNIFDHKLSVASNVPMIDGKKLVIDFGAGPGEDIKGIWVRELEFRTI